MSGVCSPASTGGKAREANRPAGFVFGAHSVWVRFRPAPATERRAADRATRYLRCLSANDRRPDEWTSEAFGWTKRIAAHGMRYLGCVSGIADPTDNRRIADRVSGRIDDKTNGGREGAQAGRYRERKHCRTEYHRRTHSSCARARRRRGDRTGLRHRRLRCRCAAGQHDAEYRCPMYTSLGARKHDRHVTTCASAARPGEAAAVLNQ